MQKKWLNLMKKGNLNLYFFALLKKLVESHENKEAKKIKHEVRQLICF
jgi:hypothetical protein